jgi:LytS/YehU family sensor histidine kinase
MIAEAFMSLSAWYVCRSLPLPSTRVSTVLVSVSAAALLSAALWLLACYAWASALDWIAPDLAPPSSYGGALPLVASFGVGLFLIAAAVHYLIGTLQTAQQAERDALELQVLARDAELKALRAQIDPHFLFNSLNSISALTGADPPAARTMTLMLADFLRLSMRYGALETIRLEQEVELARSFLEIERTRFGSRLSVETDVPRQALGALVPPLLLQPLMENAVTHGIARRTEGGAIVLRADVRGGRLQITVTNPLEPGAPGGAREGMGLAIVRRRIERSYGGEGSMTVENTGSLFTVQLTFPCLDHARSDR